MSRLRTLAWLWLAVVWLGDAAAGEPLRDRPHCQQDLFCLQAERDGETITLWLEVQTATPLILVVRPEPEGLDGPSAPLRRLTAAPGRQALARYRIHLAGAWRLGWQYSFHPGGEPVTHTPDGAYRLPYAPGNGYRVIQGAEGAFSHQGPLANAIDWAMPVGSELRAIRAGTVIGLRADAAGGGPDPDKRGTENFLWVRHDDGTVAHYLHLLKDSLLVELGQRVQAGQAIARSGNSGFSTEPHLHIHVAGPSAEGPEAFESFPLLFDLEGGRVGGLEAGQRYVAPSP